MAKLTSAILQKIAPQTKAELRDRFLPYLNEALPRYGIINELQVAGFLATAAFESQYFQKTKEGKARPSNPIWIKYQSKYWHTNFMGRGIFQTTHEKNYRTFGQKMKKKGLVEDSEIFVKHPELLEQPRWAVESACEYWETNHLDTYARQGFKGFSALQGKVNKGSASKVAHDYGNRLIVYERTRLALPDDFKLDSAASSTPTATESAVTSSPLDEPSVSAEPPTNLEVTQTSTTVNDGNTETLAVTAKNEQDVNTPAVVDAPQPYREIGLGGVLKNDAKAILPANIGVNTVSEWIQQTTGWPTWLTVLIPKLAIVVVVCTFLWLLYRVLTYLVWKWTENERVKLLATINANPKTKDLILK